MPDRRMRLARAAPRSPETQAFMVAPPPSVPSDDVRPAPSRARPSLPWKAPTDTLVVMETRHAVAPEGIVSVAEVLIDTPQEAARAQVASEVFALAEQMVRTYTPLEERSESRS
jgi:hypothetical protein